MKYIIIASLVSFFSVNSFALGEQTDKGCHYCTPCKKVVCKDTQVDSRRVVTVKSEASSTNKGKTNKPTASGQ